MKHLLVFLIMFSAAASGCTPRKTDGPEAAVSTAISKPLPPEDAKAMLSEVGQNWLYGEGIGDTALTVTGIVIFPPYVLWVLGNAALSLTGYEPLKVSQALPKEAGEAWDDTYGTVASGPGRFSAALAGKEYRHTELAKERLSAYIPQ